MKALNKHLNNVKTLCFLDLEGTQFSHEMIAIGAVKVSIRKDGSVKRFIVESTRLSKLKIESEKLLLI